MDDIGGQNPDDAMLLAAIRKRMLADLERRGDMSTITNNVYGTGGGVSGLMGQPVGEPPDPREDMDYFVDIMRQNVPEGDEEMPAGGWRKNVHRYSKKKAPQRTRAEVEEPSLRD